MPRHSLTVPGLCLATGGTSLCHRVLHQLSEALDSRQQPRVGGWCSGGRSASARRAGTGRPRRAAAGARGPLADERRRVLLVLAAAGGRRRCTDVELDGRGVEPNVAERGESGGARPSLRGR